MTEVHVVGLGEVGRRLAGACSRGGADVGAVTRTGGWESMARAGGPVLVCVREEDLPGVLPRLETVAAERLVFVQNGWVRPLLAALGGCSRGIVWFTSKGELFASLRPSLFAGPRAGEVVDLLRSGGLEAAEITDADCVAAEVEKMGFNCVVGLPLAVHACSLAEYLGEYEGEAREVFAEAVTVLGRSTGVVPEPGWWETFRRSAVPLWGVRVQRAKALEWRNGAVVREAERLGMRAPVNAALLRRVHAAG